jgi:type IV pilus modification protein PilV
MLKKKIAQAFTLVEVLVAMLILAIGLLGLAGITVVVLRSNTLSQQISEATSIATSLMENLRQLNAAQMAAAACDTTDLPNNVSDADDTGCALLTEAGIAGAQNNFFPPTRTQGGTVGTFNCGVTGLLEGTTGAGTDYTVDIIAGNLANRVNIAEGDFCPTVAAAAANLTQNQYIRYYRISDVTPSGSTLTDYRLIAVVMFRDKFGKWRSIRLDTRRTI